jgi:alpha-glucuronidase
VDRERYEAVLHRLEYQAGHAIVWRDAIDAWFARESGIADAHGRVGHHAGRVEAEAMTLDGYEAVSVTPWETASEGRAVSCARPAPCTATQTFRGAVGSYDVAVQYFDENDGASRFTLTVGGRAIDRWTADGDYPSPDPNGHTSTRHVVRAVMLAPGDTIQISGLRERGESAVLDYIEVTQR